MNATERIFAKGLRLHRSGRLAEAEQLYRQVLSKTPHHADSLHWLGVIGLQTGNLAPAGELISAAVRIRPNDAIYHSNLGLVYQNQGKLDQAAACFERALALQPHYPEARNNLGVLLQRQGQLGAAVAQFEQAIELRPGYSDAVRNLAQLHFVLGNNAHQAGQPEVAVEHYSHALAQDPKFAEAQFNLGNALRDLGELGPAAATYERALALNPRLTPAYQALGVLALIEDLPEKAVEQFEQALAIEPALTEAHYNLAIALMGLDRKADAVERFERALSLKPDYIAAHFNLANALVDLGRPTDASAHYEKTLALDPTFAQAQIALGNLRFAAGAADRALMHFREAQRLEPLRRQAAIKPQPDFSALLLTAPGPVNTPSEYLLSRATFDGYTLMLLPGMRTDIQELRARADVIVNLIAEVDGARTELVAAAELVDALGRPVINHPRDMLCTDRMTVAKRLSLLPQCRVARTLRLEPHERLLPDHIELSFPVLARVTGTHGGKSLEKCADAAALAQTLARHPESAHYVSEYLPYQSSDGYFRKYRLIFVNEAILPYHLAVGSHWKMHYFSSDMAKTPRLRVEEEAFLRDPRRVLGSVPWAALEAVRTALGLDFAGIDCGIDADGKLVVFEANATMLVHDEKGLFAYKAPFIAAIKRAFASMLARAADSQANVPR
jgi:tetratricopeptide (TPR) repeat protein/glutathione synthase/RimK-type ligase-like ATP-grasp enzyme